MKQFLFSLSLGLMFLLAACGEKPLDDLTVNITGTYEGIVTLHLGTDSARDVENQRIVVTKVDDETIEISMSEYPDSSPVDSLTLNVSLTQTPDGFTQTNGLSLVINPVSFQEGTVKGTPYLTSSLGQPLSEDGKYVNDTQELLFTLEIMKNGTAIYELFQGFKQ